MLMNKKVYSGQNVGVFNHNIFPHYMNSRFSDCVKVIESQNDNAVMMDYYLRQHKVHLIYESPFAEKSDVSVFVSGDAAGVSKVERIISEVRDSRY